MRKFFYKKLPLGGEKGLTLIEIVIVIAILGILGTIVGANLFKRFGRAKIGTTKLAIEQVEQALNEYQMDRHRFPAAGDMQSALRDYMDKVPTDSWGNEFRFEVPGPNGMPFDIISNGPDGTPNTEDDISLSKIKNQSE